MASLTNKLLRYKPQSWMTSNVDSTRTAGYVQIERPRCSTEFEEVQRKIRVTLSNTIIKVERVESPFLFECYELKKAEYRLRCPSVTEKTLFHCTAASSITSILTNNLDWRRSSRTKFGQGVSFSPSASYANKYASYSIGSSRAMIVSKVLVGSSCLGNSSMSIPRNNYDTSTGNSQQVYVKYCDNEFYPEYVAYYNNCDFDNVPYHNMFPDDDDDVNKLVYELLHSIFLKKTR